MILKQLRISRYLSQEQLAEMSGLSVRTIQRIESGQNASTESLKCLAASLNVDIETLNQEKLMLEQNVESPKSMSPILKAWFMMNYLQSNPKRSVSIRIEVISQLFGFIFCFMGLVYESTLVGGLIFLTNAHLFRLLTWQGDKYGIWQQESVIDAS